MGTRPKPCSGFTDYMIGGPANALSVSRVEDREEPKIIIICLHLASIRTQEPFPKLRRQRTPELFFRNGDMLFINRKGHNEAHYSLDARSQYFRVLRLILSPSQNMGFRDGLHAVDSGLHHSEWSRFAHRICPRITDDQSLDQQRAALKAVGCKRIFEEKASGAKRDRPQLAVLFDQLRPGDVVTMLRTEIGIR